MLPQYPFPLINLALYFHHDSGSNSITSIKALRKCDWPNLKLLSLSKNVNDLDKNLIKNPHQLSELGIKSLERLDFFNDDCREMKCVSWLLKLECSVVELSNKLFDKDCSFGEENMAGEVGRVLVGKFPTARAL